MKYKTINRVSGCVFACAMFVVPTVGMGQEMPSFVDGYHGGVEGHYPPGTTQFIVDTLRKVPEWKLSFEIEPATWQSELVKNPEAFNSLKQMIAKEPDRFEFVSGAYGQPYFWNINGESLIRQFTYGIQEIHKNFPDVTVKTYVCEEPCWTSSMPQILKSLGFSYSVLKNPNTCWGGYSVGKDAEIVNWVGSDGSSIPAVPRYVGEREIGCRATQASINSTSCIQEARKAGILHPVGMNLQDAGRMAGPNTRQEPSIFRTWREYFEKVAIKPPYPVSWNFSQEDLRVSLMWGAQILQGVAQNVRRAEDKLLVTEKLSAMAALGAGVPWRDNDFHDAWRTLLLSQHHDCWIVPCNRHPAGNWATQVADVWVSNTLGKCDSIVDQALQKLAAGNGTPTDQHFVRVFNPVSVDRNEIATLALPSGWKAGGAKVFDDQNHEVPCQVNGDSSHELVFLADVPSLGYSTYRMEPSAPAPPAAGARADIQPDGKVLIETDIYKILLDPSKGGTISSLYDKVLKREFVDASNPRHFNEYRGYFTDASAWISSADTPAVLRIVENGPVRVTVTASGKIGDQPYVSTITASQGQKRLEMKVRINWIGSPRIGENWSGGSVKSSFRKPCYDDRYKLQAVFPCALEGPVALNKNAAFDVCKSANDDSFFNDWHSIKHNIIVNWVDINDAAGDFGLTLMSDHTTSYAFGPNDPLGLVLCYSEPYGLWDQKYLISGPTEARYSIVPHAGTWDQSHAWRENSQWSEPLLARMMTGSLAGQPARNSLTLIRTAPGTYVPTLTMDGPDLLVRLFNAEGGPQEQTVSLGFAPASANLVELDGRVISPLKVMPDERMASAVKLSIPHFGVRTLRLTGGKWDISPNPTIKVGQ